MRDLHNDNPRTYWSRKGSTGFMIPNINSPYVYLNSLFNDFGASRRIGAIASNTLKHYENFHTNKNIDANGNLSGGNFKEGLDFLEEIIKITQQHELNFINDKIKKMQKLGELGEEEQRLIEELNKINSGDFNYKDFIELFNTIITGIEKYRMRLQGFKQKKVVNTPQLNLIQNASALVTTFTDQRKEVYYSQEELIRQLTFKFFERDAGRQFIADQISKQGIDNVIAVMAIVSQQLAQFIYDTGLLEYEKTKYKNKNIALLSPQEFKLQFDNIVEQFDEFERQHNVEEMYRDDILFEEIKRMYGITIQSKQQGNKKNTKMRDIRNTLKRDERKIFEDKSMQWPNIEKILKRIKIDFKSNGRHGELSLVNELLSAFAKGIDSHAHLGSLNLGTDILLGTLTANITPGQPPLQHDPVARTLQNIKTRLLNSAQKDYLTINTKIYEDELNKLDKQLEEIGRGFILHETTKNYSNLERGKWPGHMSSFIGREMKMSNYLKAIQSMNIKNLNIDEVRFITFNLATDALGNYLLDPLKSYLSIFGGLIMFDDFSLVAREFTENLKFSNIDNIHLYHLQDTYFPASMFLQATYNSMMQLEDELLDGNGFTVNINVPTIDYYENLTNYGTTFEQRWAGVRDYADKNTAITLYFGHNFINLMSQLF